MARKQQSDLDFEGVSRLLDLPSAATAGEPIVLGQGVVFVNHGATAGTARPANAVMVIWSGTVQPTNAVSPDIWIDRS